MNDELLNHHIYTKVIIPEVEEVRRKLLHDPWSIYPIDDANNPYQNIAIAQAGAAGQIKAIENSLHQICQDTNKKIIWAKYAAGASLSQSPNDKGVMHHTLHTLFKSPSFKRDEMIEPHTGGWITVRNILKCNIDSSSINTVWKCFTYSRVYISKAFNGVALKGAFSAAGICRPPHGHFSPQTILSQCPHFAKLSNDNAEWLLNQLPRFYEIFDENLYIPEESFAAILGERDGVDNSPPHEKENNSTRWYATVNDVLLLETMSSKLINSRNLMQQQRHPIQNVGLSPSA
jgi:hypothetical protein